MRRPMCGLSALFLLCLIILLPLFVITPAAHDRLPDVADGEKLTVTGKIKDLTRKDERLIVTLSGVRIAREGPPEEDLGQIAEDSGPPAEEYGPHGLLLYLDLTDDLSAYQISRLIRCSGTYHKFNTAENEGQFDTRAYYTQKGVDGFLTEPVLLGVSDSHSALFQGLFRLKIKLEDIFYSYLDELDANIMSALLLGEKGMLESGQKELYQNAGIAHVLSLSGLHVAVFGLGLLKLFRFLIRKLFKNTGLCLDLTAGGFVSGLIAAILSGILLLFWCIMTGFPVSMVRAFVMFLLGVCADLMSRTYDLLSAAAFSSIVAAILSPQTIYDAGFQLSFAAVCSIGILFPPVVDCFGAVERNPLLQSILLSICIQIGTLPIVAWHYYQLPLCGVLLNLMVVPLMSVVLLSGVIIAGSGLLYLASGFAIFDLFCRICGFITHAILFLYEKGAQICTSFSYAVWVTGKPSLLQVILYYLVLIMVRICLGRVCALKREQNMGMEEKRANDQTGRHNIGRERHFPLLFRMAVLCGLLIISFVIIGVRPRHLVEIRNLSVGQGDCSLVFNKTYVILIDCGSSSVDQVGRYRLIPCLKANGVQKIDTIYVSHFDSDHVNGILELLQDPVYCGRTGRIILSCKARDLDGNTDNFRNLLALAGDLKIPVFTMKAGDEIKEGDCNVVCLSPESGTEGYADTNAASLVLLLCEETIGFKALFTGDIGMESEQMILRAYDRGLIASPACNYLKVAHHGSGSSSDAAFLQAALGRSTPLQAAYGQSSTGRTLPEQAANGGFLSPIAVISVGAHNRYGHPHPDTLNRLTAIPGLHCYRTDLTGETILELDADKLCFRTMLGEIDP